MSDAQEVLDFWFDPAHESFWFERDDAFDASIRERFGVLHERAARGELAAWAAQPDTWLALLILLDQFSRNLYRGDRRAFDCDARAQRIAQEGIGRGFDQKLPPHWRAFAYLPLEHAEDAFLQERCLELFGKLHQAHPDVPLYASYADYARRHAAVIERFGRFPHRNAALDRTSTPEEAHYLAEPGAGF